MTNELSRREFLAISTLLGCAFPLAGCSNLNGYVADRFGGGIPEKISVTNSPVIDPAFHLISRAGFGPWPGDVEQIKKQGEKAWIEEQLEPESIDDRLCDFRAKRFESVFLDPGTCYEFKREALRKDLCRYHLMRSVYSKRQLLESMVEFFSDHFNIYIEKGDCIYLKATDDRAVVRKNALGCFSDLVLSSATSPAMLVYLDGKENKKEGPHGIPNENYARELLELHTLGVDGGYNQKDVYEAARCLTGWRLESGSKRGTAYFDPSLHDDGEKIVLGKKIRAGGGEKDVEALVNIACVHPSTAKHIAKKLVRHFVSEDPPESLVNSVAKRFSESGGQIKPMLREILYSSEFKASAGSKMKRPFQFVVSCLRATGADTMAGDEVLEYLTRMGHGPFQYPTPDGYPTEANPWLGTLLWRWNFAFALCSNFIENAGVSLDTLCTAIGLEDLDSIKKTPEVLFSYMAGRSPNHEESKAIKDYVSRRDFKDEKVRDELVGLILSSPAFQKV
ncbi:MAG: hypothetical protein DKT66_22655 [Candidatus Melainabacteria bacterium]|nr:MAG: hypothetical protein DKT66_22655 [Candidatus Melainabacteria bacterium]